MGRQFRGLSGIAAGVAVVLALPGSGTLMAQTAWPMRLAMAQGGAEPGTSRPEPGSAARRPAALGASLGSRWEAALLRAESLLEAGDAQAAARSLDEAMADARLRQDRRLMARLALVQGGGEYRSGRMEAALGTLRMAVDLFGQLGDPVMANRASLDLALVAAAMDQPAAALDELALCLSRARSLHDPETLAVAQLNLFRLGGTDAAVEPPLARAREVRDAIRQMEDGPRKARLLVSLGEMAEGAAGGGDQGRAMRDIAATALGEAETLSRRMGNGRLRSFALGFQARLTLKAGLVREAQDLNQRAILVAHGARAPDALYRWYWQQGRMAAGSGNRAQAIEAYRRAVRYLSEARAGADALAGSRGQGFREVFGPLYLELADLLLREASGSADAGRQGELLREARGIIESSKAAELQDYFQDSCVAAQQARVAGLDQIAQGTSVIYPVLLPDRVVLLLSHAGGIVQFEVPAPAEKIIGDVRAFRELLEKRQTRQFLAPARRLYDLIIRPLEPTLEKVGTRMLVMIPDGALRTIPLGALHDGNRYLIQKYPMAVTPGLTLTDPRPFPRAGLRALLGGLTESVQGFSALPNVTGELRAIRSVFDGEILQDSSYRVARVEAELLQHPYSLVHVASHGQFDRDPRKTFLLAYDGKVSMDTLERIIAPTRLRERAIELLTLSACQTAAGDDRAALGLAGVAIKAGARSALASLWFINDQSSAMLIAEFYRRLKQPGTSKATALQGAQLSLMADGRYSHPAYWAPFLLIGNWL